MNQYKKKRLKVLGRINHNNKYRYPRNPSLSYPSLEEGGAKLPTDSSFFRKIFSAKMTFFQNGNKFVKTLPTKWKCCATQIRL